MNRVCAFLLLLLIAFALGAEANLFSCSPLLLVKKELKKDSESETDGEQIKEVKKAKIVYDTLCLIDDCSSLQIATSYNYIAPLPAIFVESDSRPPRV